MRFADFLRRGICICGSSDSPVQSLDPWLQMLGMTQFYREEESVTPYEALRCYTVHPARALLEEKERGMLLAGMRADFFTSDRDLFSLSPTELGDFRPLDTWYGGKPAVDGRGRRQSWRGCSFADRKKSERKIKRENCSFFYVSSRKSVMIGIEKYNGIRGWNYEQNYYGCQRVRERRA